MAYLAAVAVNKRQNYISSADKLQEMLGGSRLIEETVESAKRATAGSGRVIRPVSGEVWIEAPTRTAMRNILREVRRDLVEEYRLSVTFAVIEETPEERANFKLAGHRLERELRNRKDNRKSPEAFPASPVFARCRIQPELPANFWYGEEEREPRRSLVSAAALLRQEYAEALWNGLCARLPELRQYERPRDTENLAPGEGDSYIALVKGDVDRLGLIQMNTDWDAVAPPIAGKDLYRDFSKAVDEAVRASVDVGIRAVLNELRPDPKPARPFAPAIPLVMAGDDVWVLCRRKHALRFAVAAGKQFAALCGAGVIGQVAAHTKTRLSLSFGVLFAKLGFPMDQQLLFAEQLLKRAKRARKDVQNDAQGDSGESGWIDYFWLASSGRETVEGALAEGGGYCHDKKQYQLFTRPWTLDEADQMLAAARNFAAGVPRHKARQLETVLRLGGDITRVTMLQWWLRLGKKDREEAETALNEVPVRFRIAADALYKGGNGALPAGPFLAAGEERFVTPLADLVELGEIQGVWAEEES